jgi:hypothetical protein
MFVCNKNGSNVEDNDGQVVKQRKRNKTVKTGCTARLTLKKRDGRWHVTTFHEDHNHHVCDKFELKRFLRSHRGIPEGKNRMSDVLRRHPCKVTVAEASEPGYTIPPSIVVAVVNGANNVAQHPLHGRQVLGRGCRHEAADVTHEECQVKPRVHQIPQ